jgi:cell division protein FtsB
LDAINNDKIKVKQLSDLIDKLEKEIARLDHEEENLERTYRYKDLERDHDLEDKIKKDLEDQKEKLQELKAARDDLVKDIAALEDKIAED